jgi:hypothetical protein
VEGSVRRIDIVDSTGNGTAIGAAVGAGLVAGVYQWERRQPDSNLKGLLTFTAVLLGLPSSLRIGHVLDRAINELSTSGSLGRLRSRLLLCLGEVRLAFRLTSASERN